MGQLMVQQLAKLKKQNVKVIVNKESKIKIKSNQN